MATEVQNSGFFGRMIGAVLGIGAGLFLLLAGPTLLFWNEGRTVKTAAAIAEGAASAVHIEPRHDPANDNKLVHVSGQATTDDMLKDPQFGISQNALKLTRDVEMFQWKQDVDSKKKKKVGGGTTTTKTYTYETVWSETSIRSSNFKEPGHDNPDSLPYESNTQYASTIQIGDLALDDTLRRMVDGGEDLVVTEAMLATGSVDTAQRPIKIVDGLVYIGADPSQPAVGDVRIRFEIVPPGPVSVLGRQTGSNIGAYATSNGYAVHDLAMGSKSMDEMFDAQTESNGVLAWVLRVVGIGMVFMGFTLTLGPLQVFADILPFMGRIAGFMIGVVAVMGTGACTLPTIGFAWVFYRPLLGFALLAIGAVFTLALLAAVGAAFKLTSKKAESPA